MKYNLGKGEVVSSILTGSTTNARHFAVSYARGSFLKPVRYGTVTEHDVSIRGKSVEYVRICSQETAMKVWHQEAMELRAEITGDAPTADALRRLLWEVAHNETSTPGTLRLLAELVAEFKRERAKGK